MGLGSLGPTVIHVEKINKNDSCLLQRHKIYSKVFRDYPDFKLCKTIEITVHVF